MGAKLDVLPEFNEDGNLPSGKYVVSFEEVVDRFGGQIYHLRRLRTKSLIEFHEFVKEFAVGMYIDGSYITSKFSPGDVDILLLLPSDFDIKSLQAKRLTWWKTNKKTRFIDLFYYLEGKHEVRIRGLLDGWTTDLETGKPKGIVYVEL